MSSNSSTPSGATGSVVDTETKRLLALDVLRGIAVLGILVISIWEFGGFTFNEQTFYRTGHHGGNYTLLNTVSILFEGKMRALLALVFGAGIILLLQKKDHPILISPADAYIRRLIWLIIFGVFNAFILLWPGDILFQYGVVGILLFGFSGIKARGLFIAAMVCTLVYCGKQYWNYADDKSDYKNYIAVTAVEKKFKQDSTLRAQKDSINRTKDTTAFKETLAKNKLADSIAKKKDTLTSKQAEEKVNWEGKVNELKYDSGKTKAANKAMRNGYGKIWNHLVAKSQNKESGWLYKTGIWDIASMMLLGMFLFSIGFFNSRFSSSKYLVIALFTLAAGFALAWFRVRFNDARLADYAKYIDKNTIPYDQFFPLERILLATGYASLVLSLLRLKLINWFWSALAATGRMALTNYIMQSVICTFIFYGYGFGYFGRLTQCELYFIVAEIALVQIIFSVFWLRYYNTGPLEWLWRCLTCRKWMPIKKQMTSSSAPDS